jgi:fucose permease
MVFVSSAIGFMTSAFFIDVIRANIGRARTFMLGCGMMACGYIIMLCSPPFGAVIFSFFLLGFGRAITNSLANVFLVNLQNGTNLLGMSSGSYGLGGTIG